MTACPKPAPRPAKPPRPLRRKKAMRRGEIRKVLEKKKRKKTLISKYLHPAWKRLRARALRRDRYLCRLRHPGCTIKATTVHHLRYAKGRGVKRLLVDLEFLLSACLTCHRVEDPWLGKGFGRGSRKRNREVNGPTEKCTAITGLMTIPREFRTLTQ